MIRLLMIGGRWYGLKVPVLDDEEVENLETFVGQGEVVILCDALADVAEFLDVDAVEMVE